MQNSYALEQLLPLTTRSNKVQDYFDQTDRYLKYHHRVELRKEIVRDLLKHVVGVKILDVGCGDGSISLQFLSARNQIVLVDLSKNMLDKARDRIPGHLAKQVKFHHEDFLQYKSTAPFDIILCLGVLAHVPSVENAIARIRSLLTSGGVCILQFTDQAKLIARLTQLSRVLARKSIDNAITFKTNHIVYTQIMQMCYRHGLKFVEMRRYSVMFPGMGFLPDRLLYRYQKFFLNNFVGTKFGSEVILMLNLP